MSRLSLKLFGSFHTRLEGRAVGSFGSLKAQGLLAYLALRSEYPHSRASLTALLWPDQDQRSAGRSLRQTLYLLNKGIENAQQPTPFLLNDGHSIQFNGASECSVDVLDFREYLRQRRFAEAVDLYSGDLLAGFDCGSSEFDAWATAEREHCHHQALHAWRALGEEALAAREHGEAIAAARRLLTLEPWHEAGHRLLMRALAANGDRADAVLQFSRCKQVLRQELAAAPSPETEAVYAAIVAGTFPAAPSSRSHLSSQARAHHTDDHVSATGNQVIDGGGIPSALNWIVAEEQQPLDEIVRGQGFTIHSPPPGALVPETAGFVGRRQEIAHHSARLSADGLTVIRGMAGVGKTALAATLCHHLVEDQDYVLWHAFYANEGSEIILWKLAAFLARHGETKLWNLLESTRLTGGNPPPTDTMVDYVIQAARMGSFLFCLDDYQHIDADPVLNQLVRRLIQLAKGGSGAGVIITSRRLPSFVQAADYPPLAGLSQEDAFLLAHQVGLALTRDQLRLLYAHTAGNAVFLTLALETLAKADHAGEILAKIVQIEDVEAYLLREFFDSLSAAERAVMEAISIGSGHPGSRDLIEELVGEGVYHTLQHLVRRHLLTVQHNAEIRTYRQHDIVRAILLSQHEPPAATALAP